MNWRKLSLISATFFLTAPIFANTYYGGLEDLKNGDYDYNDIVFTLNGNGLTLHSDGQWYNKPASLNTLGVPFWNNTSWDGAAQNVGYCIYGGGNCGAGLDANAQYLANSASNAKSANNVYFTVDQGSGVSAQVNMRITIANDDLYYYYTADPTHLMSMTSMGNNLFSFSATGSFGIAATNRTTGATYYSQNDLDGWNDPNSHFAFFGNTAAAPEPGAIGLMAGGLLLVGTLLRRRHVQA